jgi:hypothetical protein
MKCTDDQVNRRLDSMRSAFPEALIVVSGSLTDAMDCIPDPGDRHVLAAAIRGKAHAILTLNQRDFPPECLAQYDIDRMSPDQFLIHQYHLSPQGVLDKIDAQAVAIGETRKTIAERFRKRLQAPNFADILDGKEASIENG